MRNLLLALLFVIPSLIPSQALAQRHHVAEPGVPPYTPPTLADPYLPMTGVPYEVGEKYTIIVYVSNLAANYPRTNGQTYVLPVWRGRRGVLYCQVQTIAVVVGQSIYVPLNTSHFKLGDSILFEDWVGVSETLGTATGNYTFGTAASALAPSHLSGFYADCTE